MPFPLLKFVSLGLKQASKFVAIHVKNEAKSNPTFKKFIVKAAQRKYSTDNVTVVHCKEQYNFHTFGMCNLLLVIFVHLHFLSFKMIDKTHFNTPETIYFFSLRMLILIRFLVCLLLSQIDHAFIGFNCNSYDSIINK